MTPSGSQAVPAALSATLVERVRVAILAGDSTRLAEEGEIRPTAMVEIGGQPILWHVMSRFASHGLKDFAIALGYKGEYVKRYMLDYSALSSDLSLDFKSGWVERSGRTDDWKIDLVDTGFEAGTGASLKRLQPYLGKSTFVLARGDSVSDVDLRQLLLFHRAHGRLATVTAVRPPARFGKLRIDGDSVVEFAEKSQLEEGWINGALYVLEPEVFDYIGDASQWEREPMARLAAAGELMAYRHDSFWQRIETLRDRRLLESLWLSGGAPWKSWH